jgi:hypothetical protein
MNILYILKVNGVVVHAADAHGVTAMDLLSGYASHPFVAQVLAFLTSPSPNAYPPQQQQQQQQQQQPYYPPSALPSSSFTAPSHHLSAPPNMFPSSNLVHSASAQAKSPSHPSLAPQAAKVSSLRLQGVASSAPPPSPYSTTPLKPVDPNLVAQAFQAAYNGNFDVVTSILTVLRENLDGRRNNRNQTLLYAALRGTVESFNPNRPALVEALLDTYRVDPDAVSGDSNSPPVHALYMCIECCPPPAKQQQILQLFEILRSRNVDLFATDIGGATVVHLLKAKENESFIRHVFALITPNLGMEFADTGEELDNVVGKGMEACVYSRMWSSGDQIIQFPPNNPQAIWVFNFVDMTLRRTESKVTRNVRIKSWPTTPAVVWEVAPRDHTGYFLDWYELRDEPLLAQLSKKKPEGPVYQVNMSTFSLEKTKPSDPFATLDGFRLRWRPKIGWDEEEINEDIREYLASIEVESQVCERKRLKITRKGVDRECGTRILSYCFTESLLLSTQK